MRPTGTTPPPSAGRRPGTVASFPPGHAAFADRVMAAVARQPRPGVWRSFVTSLLRLHLGDAGAALRSAWRLAFERARPVMPLVRLQSLLLVVVLAALLGAGGVLAAGGAVRVFEELGRSGPGDRQPVVTAPSPGSTVAPGGDGAIELPSGDDGTGAGDDGTGAGDDGTGAGDDGTGAGDDGTGAGEGERRQQEETRTHERKRARMPQPGRRVVRREAGKRRKTSQAACHGMMVSRAGAPWEGSGQPGPGTSRQRLPPSSDSPSPARLPDRVQSKRNPAHATEAGPRGGDQA